MTEERSRDVEDLTLFELETKFHKLADLDSQARQRQIQAISDQNPHEGAALKALFQHLQSLESQETSPRERPFEPGFKLGHFEIKALLGKGGMGSVYLARQLKPFERDVAIKVAHQLMSQSKYRSRFQFESEALARLDHPTIAKIFEAGQLPSGPPFIAMERIEGIPIDAYCEKKGLGFQERLSLFIQVCEGIRHAHQCGLLHRDIKANNILVTEVDGAPIPKIIDFGIAMKTEDQNKTQGSVVGTPAYMSPEQAKGSQIDATSDVFSLGMLAYRLFGELLPYTEERESRDIIARLGKLGDKPFPTVSQMGGNVMKNLPKITTCDFDRVVQKCTHFLPEKRFQTVHDLVLDLKNIKDMQPLNIGPQSFRYRFHHYFKRHTFPILLFGALFFAILFGFIGTGVGLVQSQSSLEKAEIEKARADAMNSFLLELITAPDPHIQGHDVRVLDILNEAEPRIEKQFANQVEIKAQLFIFLGRTLKELGKKEEARTLFQKAQTLGQTKNALSASELLQAKIEEGETYQQTGDFEKGLQVTQDAIDEAESLKLTNDPAFLQGLNNLAVYQQYLGRQDVAGQLMRRCIAGRQKVLGETHEKTLLSRSNYVSYLNLTQQFHEAIAEAQKLAPLIENSLGSNHPTTIHLLQTLCETWLKIGEVKKAQEMIVALKKNAHQCWGESHPKITLVHDLEAKIDYTLQKYAVAEEKYQAILPAFEKEYIDFPKVPTKVLKQIGISAYYQGEFAKAIQTFESLYPRVIQPDCQRCDVTFEMATYYQLRSYIQLNDYENAKKLLEKIAVHYANSQDDKFAQNHLRRTKAWLELSQGHYDKAEHAAKFLFRQNEPEFHFQGLELLIEIYKAQNDQDNGKNIKVEMQGWYTAHRNQFTAEIVQQKVIYLKGLAFIGQADITEIKQFKHMLAEKWGLECGPIAQIEEILSELSQETPALAKSHQNQAHSIYKMLWGINSQAAQRTAP